MNAAKKIRKLIENGTDAEQIAVLTELARALEFGRDFNLARLYEKLMQRPAFSETIPQG